MHERPDPLLAALLKRLREEREVTQEQLAFDADITVSSLSRIERGLNSPGWTTLRKIVGALGVSLSELVASLERGRHPQALRSQAKASPRCNPRQEEHPQ